MADSFNPPQAVQSAARRGLRLREKVKGGTEVGVARARDLSNGRAVSLDTIGRMVSYFARHGAQKPSNPGSDANPTPWLVAWLLWGGDAGRDWAESVWRRNGSTEAAEVWRDRVCAVVWRDTARPDPVVPEGLTLGRAFRLASEGTVFGRFSGRKADSLSRADLESMAESVTRSRDADPVVIDWAHASAPDDPASQDPARGAPLGRVVDAWVEDAGDGRGPGLYVRPAWTERAAAVVPGSVGALWSSPEWYRGTTHDRATGEAREGCHLLAVGLTPRPAQRNDRLDPIRWREKGGPMEGELSQEAFDALRAERDALAARVAELEAAEGSMEGEATAEMAEVAKMREALASQSGEVVKLREAHTKLVNSLEAERCERMLDRIVGEGRQPESAREVGRQLWSVREKIPAAWKSWAEAPAQVPARVTSPGAGPVVPEDPRAAMVAKAEAEADKADPAKGQKWREAKSATLLRLMKGGE